MGDDPMLLQVTRHGLETFPTPSSERFASSERETDTTSARGKWLRCRVESVNYVGGDSATS